MLVDTFVNVVLSLLPSPCIAAMAATAIKSGDQAIFDRCGSVLVAEKVKEFHRSASCRQAASAKDRVKSGKKSRRNDGNYRCCQI